MTELQMGLIGLGATAVVGVFAYNKWQEYRHRKLAEAVLKPQHDDVLLADSSKVAAPEAPAVRSEPELRPEAPGPAPERLEPSLGNGQAEAPTLEAMASEPTPASWAATTFITTELG